MTLGGCEFEKDHIRSIQPSFRLENAQQEQATIWCTTGTCKTLNSLFKKASFSCYRRVTASEVARRQNKRGGAKSEAQSLHSRFAFYAPSSAAASPSRVYSRPGLSSAGQSLVTNCLTRLRPTACIPANICRTKAAARPLVFSPSNLSH